jgi:hypothetical protein
VVETKCRPISAMPAIPGMFLRSDGGKVSREAGNDHIDTVSGTADGPTVVPANAVPRLAPIFGFVSGEVVVARPEARLTFTRRCSLPRHYTLQAGCN